ncbi:CAP domain-containing protein [Rubrobacter indicoceani]|uniref:CAP domain-containing protein n=1 Tax=Rubrobacter indicoceani TaxID=2051957 RepID=UPI0019694D8C|nr:CAP domain-containing protein [Rubrobacter indicoceani]
MKRYYPVTAAALLFAALMLAAISLSQPKVAQAAGYEARKCGGGSVSLNAAEYRTFQLHNQVRKNNGLSKLCVHPRLVKAARGHSRDMIDRGYFSHTTQGTGQNAGQRITAAGYPWRTYGENIGYNSTPEAMHNAWMNSSGHRTNILNRNFKEVGIGAVTGQYPSSRGGTFETTMYTVNFGAR